LKFLFIATFNDVAAVSCAKGQNNLHPQQQNCRFVK